MSRRIQESNSGNYRHHRKHKSRNKRGSKDHAVLCDLKGNTHCDSGSSEASVSHLETQRKSYKRDNRKSTKNVHSSRRYRYARDPSSDENGHRLEKRLSSQPSSSSCDSSQVILHDTNPSKSKDKTAAAIAALDYYVRSLQKTLDRERQRYENNLKKSSAKGDTKNKKSSGSGGHYAKAQRKPKTDEATTTDISELGGYRHIEKQYIVQHDFDKNKKQPQRVAIYRNTGTSSCYDDVRDLSSATETDDERPIRIPGKKKTIGVNPKETTEYSSLESYAIQHQESDTLSTELSTNITEQPKPPRIKRPPIPKPHGLVKRKPQTSSASVQERLRNLSKQHQIYKERNWMRQDIECYPAQAAMTRSTSARSRGISMSSIVSGDSSSKQGLEVRGYIFHCPIRRIKSDQIDLFVRPMDYFEPPTQRNIDIGLNDVQPALRLIKSEEVFKRKRGTKAASLTTRESSQMVQGLEATIIKKRRKRLKEMQKYHYTIKIAAGPNPMAPDTHHNR